MLQFSRTSKLHLKLPSLTMEKKISMNTKYVFSVEYTCIAAFMVSYFCMEQDLHIHAE